MAANEILFDNAQIRFRNFIGAKGRYNAEGDRNFCLLLDPADASQMEADGWKVKYLKPRDDQDEPTPYIQVAVNYKSGRPPKIVMITSKGKTVLQEDMVFLLDWAEIENIDLIINKYEWEVNGNSGIKAYLKSMYVTIREDELDRRYMDVPDTGLDSLPVEPDPVS